MRRPTALSTFVVTVAVLGAVVAMSLRKAGATSDGSASGTSVVYHNVAALTRSESAKVHVTNLSKDQSAPAVRFMIMFADARGVLLLPEKVCEVRASETCTVTLPSSACPAGFTRADDDDHDNRKGPRPPRCEFRAVVVGETLACSPTGGAGPEWMTDLELVDASGGSKFVVGPNTVLKLPRESCTGGNDTGTAPPDFSTPPDSSTPPDFSTPPDSSTPPDLTRLPDLVTPPDFTTPPPADLATPPDLRSPPPPPPDLTNPPDLLRSDLAGPPPNPAPAGAASFGRLKNH